LWAYDLQTQADLIRQAKELLSNCLGTPISAFRAGDLAANADTLSAMKANGLLVGSNRDLDAHGSIASRVNEVFPVKNDVSIREGITDLPVSCFESPFPWLDGRYRHLQITAAGHREMIYVLRRMERLGYRAATILTHPGEFYCRTARGFVPNRKNCRRWEKLLGFLSTSGWMVSAVREVGLLDGGSRSGAEIVRGSLVWARERVAQQVWWRIFSREY